MVTRRSVFCLTRNTGSEVAEGETGRGRGLPVSHRRGAARRSLRLHENLI